MHCPHCNVSVMRLSQNGQKVKLPTSCLILHKSGAVEVNCPACKQGILLPLVVQGEITLKKAHPASLRHVFRKEVWKPDARCEEKSAPSGIDRDDAQETETQAVQGLRGRLPGRSANAS
jgi:hypothetical protein